ncbi:MAG TPA: BCCT family transporter [Bacillota bacterium]|nr:BCCT family transporter [Bacillota bacterium]
MLTDRKLSQVFYVSAVTIFLFVLWGVLSPSSLNSGAGFALGWMIENFGWFYMLITAFFVLFVIVLAISPYGRIRLGKPDERPEFSWISWIGMLFAAGIGVGFVFFGVAEPVLYYLDPPVGYDPESQGSAIAGLRYGAYHWALHPWAIFSIVGLTLAYVQFKKDRPALISSAFYPLLGDKINGWTGKTIDILAVLATCMGVATTFGLSAMQMTGGLSYLTPLPNNVFVQIVIIIIVTCLFILSAARGIDKGIKVLSNINIAIAGLLLLFVISIGPTLFIAENFVTTLGGYITNIIPMSLTLTPFSESEWLGTNTIFFWAWHISWSPFMGLFIARISRGRTIREFMLGVLLVPSLLAILWFTTFGGTALNIELFGAGGLASLVTDNVELALFATFEQLPLTAITSTISMFLIFIFFITSADSATYVLGSMTSRGSLTPSMTVKVIWGLLIAGTASVLLISGGGGLDALQTAAIVTAFPFAIIMVLMIVSILTMLQKDWKLYQRDRTRERNKEVKEEVFDEVKEQTYDDIKDQVFDEVKEQTYDEIKDQVFDEVKEQTYDDIKDQVFDEVKEQTYDEIKDQVFDEIKEQTYDEIKEQVFDEVKEQTYDDIKDQVFDEVKEQTYDEFKDQIYDDMKKELKEELVDELNGNDKK